MLFSARVTNFRDSRILNICDPSLLGKKIKKGNHTINISKDYYGEKLVELDEAKNLLKTCSTINMVGEQTIDLSIKMGIGSSLSVKRIDDVPFLLVFKM